MYHCTCITYMTLPIYTIYIVLHTIPPMSIPNRHCYTKCYYIVTYCNVLWRAYSVYTFCDHKYIPMWSQICIYLMWLTPLFSWSVCFCVYTYPTTPGGPCTPLRSLHFFSQTISNRHGEKNIGQYIHQPYIYTLFI